MGLDLTVEERVARARADLRMGAPVVLTGVDARVLAIAAEEITAPRLSACRALGAPYLALTRWRAETLKARAYDGDLARVAVPGDADTSWIRATADPGRDLATPLKGPYAALRGGSPELARAAIRLAKDAQLLPAVVLVPLDDGSSVPPEITHLSLSDLASRATALREVSGARVPLHAGPSQVRVFRPADGGEEHYAVEIGAPSRSTAVLVRLHSACFTGDVIGSRKCDCGPQLHGALDQITAAAAGILLYLNQEGRGIGLANKMRAYALQDQGFDTVEANHRLGFEDDERDFRIGAEMLKAMGVERLRLMTNNPAKVARMQAMGLEVIERVPLAVGATPENADYLATKAAKSGHLL